MHGKTSFASKRSPGGAERISHVGKILAAMSIVTRPHDVMLPPTGWNASRISATFFSPVTGLNRIGSTVSWQKKTVPSGSSIPMSVASKNSGKVLP
ncbi:MAG: hypothetical protein L0Y44_12600 [Phycisphaerales bacterium]|nr:hypothetical protein [Phycisphaerales bacterium]